MNKEENKKDVFSNQEKINPSGNKPEEGQHNLVQLTFVVSGEETIVKANLNNRLRKAMEEALQQTGNAEARPFDDWRVRYNGHPITNFDLKIEEYGIDPGNLIYLSLDSGTGGSVFKMENKNQL